MKKLIKVQIIISKKLNLLVYIKKLMATIAILTMSTSCAFFNDKHVSVPFTSNPIGAKLYINQQYAGETPIEINVIPDGNKVATFVYNGQRKDVPMKIWVSIRENRNKFLDSSRCLLDVLGLVFILPAASFMSVKCKDFNKKIYSASFTINSNKSRYENYSY
jgi:hypothetical protein